VTIDSDLLEAKIAELLDVFYEKRKESLKGLRLITTLKRKNPYLYRAIGVSDASDIVEELLHAHVSSSDETLFGNEFFEPLAKWVAEQASLGDDSVTVQIGAAEGSDLTIDHGQHYEAYAIKSGINVFNAQSRKRQIADFSALRSRLSKLKKRFDPIVGYCYGRKEQRDVSKAAFIELAGQKLWSHLTGEEDFYLRIIRLMQAKPLQHRPIFVEEFAQAKNRFVFEFLETFANDGVIDWDKLTAFNSGQTKPKTPKNPSKKIR